MMKLRVHMYIVKKNLHESHRTRLTRAARYSLSHVQSLIAAV